jgi:hypothetical protein
MIRLELRKNSVTRNSINIIFERLTGMIMSRRMRREEHLARKGARERGVMHVGFWCHNRKKENNRKT